MSKLIILRGNSGSGKTVVAKELQRKFGPNTMLLSQDMVRMDILHVWGKEGIEKSASLLTDLLRYGSKHSAITILEGILPAADYTSLFSEAESLFGENIFAYYYDIPFEETLRRHNTKPNHNDFGEEDMRRWWREKDFLPHIQEKILDEHVSFDDAVEMIYREANG